MSGGFFEYAQYKIDEMVDSIERELNRQGKLKSKDEFYGNEDYYIKYPDEMFYPTYSKEIQYKMNEAIKALKIAAVYVQRIDWFLSGDDGEESFLERLKEELNELES